MDKCAECKQDLAQEEYITAIMGVLFCKPCADKKASPYAEEVSTKDIGIRREFKCGHCDKVSSAFDWDKMTTILCSNRKQRRNYVSILRNKINKYYKCPMCTKTVSREDIKEV
jgi:uncharacterized CHY-type Zn-finger protein